MGPSQAAAGDVGLMSDCIVVVSCHHIFYAERAQLDAILLEAIFVQATYVMWKPHQCVLWRPAMGAV